MIPWEELEEIPPAPRVPISHPRKLQTERQHKRQIALDEKRAQAARSCGRKRQYQTQALALGVAAKSQKANGITLTTYECQVCGLWHLTHHAPRGKR